jgi:predicted GNAT family acetyltransferase
MTDATSRVQRNDAEERYEILLDDQVVGSAYFSRQGDTITFIHTEVDDRFQHRGLAGDLARASLDDAGQQGWTVVPQCSFIAGFIQRNPEYRRLVTGSGTRR